MNHSINLAETEAESYYAHQWSKLRTIAREERKLRLKAEEELTNFKKFHHSEMSKLKNQHTQVYWQLVEKYKQSGKLFIALLNDQHENI